MAVQIIHFIIFVNFCLQVSLCIQTTQTPTQTTIRPTFAPLCQSNSDCAAYSVCVQGRCLSRICSMCDGSGCRVVDCGPNAECDFVDQQPRCSCIPPYEYTGCGCQLDPPAQNCTSAEDCPMKTDCIDGICIDNCYTLFCAGDALCNTHEHDAYCYCHHGSYYHPSYGCILIEEEEIDEV
ncbi:uncharacterized protein LOC129005161 [Macrosteles quadrilineatus]|uniref:uncharacterized protein LOC128996165 n=1 Tax=Macrosteles quadrilineatus TaxID=74068 RepID=UPI0023E0A999|nr:uncharacterized protein LOC128996165 [Macrosteles quadrilineatus]XP_054289951.1 uncharacterized protein LOC129005161 [Macrosteles quadrilineatus]